MEDKSKSIKTFKKIDPEKLKEYVKNNPDKYLREIAADFNCCQGPVKKGIKASKNNT